MHIRDTYTIAASLEAVWDFFFDVERMGLCVPGVEQVNKVDETHYEGVIQLQVGPIRARFAGTVGLVELEPPRWLVATIQARDRATASLIEARFESELLGTNDHSTQVTYDLDLTVRGRLGQFGFGVIEETATRLTQEFVDCVQRQLRQNNAKDSRADNSGGEASYSADDVSSVPLLSIVIRAFLAVIKRRLTQILRTIKRRLTFLAAREP